MAVLLNDTLPGVQITVPDEAVPIHAISGWHRPGSTPEAEITATHPDGEPSEEPADYTGWLKADLVTEAASRGLETTGTKDELVARLGVEAEPET